MKLFKRFCHARLVKRKAVLLNLLAALLLALPGAFAQTKSVTGLVTSSSGDALAAVSVKLKGTSTGTTTNAEGRFALSVPGDNAVLVFSYLGYITKEEAVGGRSSFNIQLDADSKELSEIVVVGYGTTNKKDITGSTVTINPDNLPKMAITSVNSLIQGRAAGVNVNLASAQPGGRFNISIRGRGTPLYVIDGVPLFNGNSPERAINSYSNSAEIGFGGGIDRDPLNSINPSDIASIDILKDASAAAIYGSAASNGVVLITTKKGKADGRVTTNYTVNTTIQTPKKYFDVLNAKEFMQESVRLSRDQFLYNNNLPPYGNSTTTQVYVAPYTQADIDAAGEGTDWMDMVMRNGNIQEHNLSLSGGTPKTKMYTSINYLNNKAILQNSDFKRYTGRVNLDQQITDKLRLSVNLTVGQTKSNNASSGGGGNTEKFNSLQAAYAFAPTVGVTDANGDFAKSTNTLVTNPAAYFIIDDNLNSTSFFAAPKLEFRPISNLKFNLDVGIDRKNSNRKFYLPTKARNYLLPEGMAQVSTNAINNYSAEGYGTYTRNFGDHNFELVAGGGYYTSFSESFDAQGVGFFSDAFSYNNLGLASNKDKSFIGSNRSMDGNKISQWARLKYNYNSKYLLQLTFRNDGASQFAANKKWGFFPSVSGGWRISEEPFMKNVKAISDLKLRASYAHVGNVGNLNALALLSTGGGRYLIGNTYYSGVATSQLENPNLSWETIKETNIGIDFGLFSDRLTGSIEVYRKDRVDILQSAPLPVNNAVSTFNTNEGGEERSEGFEFALNSRNFQGKSFRWETNFNVSNNRGKSLERSPYASPLRAWQHLDDRFGTTYGWKTLGIIKSAADIPSYMPNARLGNVIYEDYSKDGKLDDNDIQYLGNSNPKWILGLGNRFSYKQLDLDVYMYGRFKQWQANNLTAFYAPSRMVADRLNTLVDIKNVWTVDNPTGTLPGIASNPYQGSAGNDFYAEDVSFVRISNISLSYNMPVKKVFRSVRFSLDVRNVGLWTNYKGYDPEINEANPYPQTLSTTLGVNLGF